MSKKAFTLVELLVVIGIIAILASVVTVNLLDSRAKGDKAFVIATLNQVAVQSSIYYSNADSYTDLFLDSSVAKQVSTIDAKIGLTPVTAALDQSWCLAVVYGTDNYCVDQNGDNFTDLTVNGTCDIVNARCN